jgi:hypothetical protein
MSNEYKFPDEAENDEQEIETSVSDDDNVVDIAIDIEDDTPERDRSAQPLSKDVADPTDEEIESYGAKVQTRIKELTHARHDERRAKEALLREKQELERLTQAILDENKRLKQYVNDGSQSYAETLQAKAQAELEMARRKYKEAQESYDTDALLEAQEALTDAKFKFEAAKNFKPQTLQVDDNVVQSRQEAPRPPNLDEKTLRWQAKNQWFGSTGYEDLTAFALGLHQKLVNSGVDPRSDDYFESIDSRLKQKFPEVFGGEDKPVKAETVKKPANVVTPASRSTGAKRTVVLTKTQARLADKLGIPHADYAKEYLKLEARP